MADYHAPPPCPVCGVKRAIVRLRRWPWRRAQWWRCYGCFTKYQADEAQQPETQPQCPGFETQPNRCSCDCEGCRHNCAAHQPAEEA